MQDADKTIPRRMTSLEAKPPAQSELATSTKKLTTDHNIKIKTAHTGHILKFMAIIPFCLSIFSSPLLFINSLTGTLLFSLFVGLTFLVLTLNKTVELDPIAKELIYNYSLLFYFKYQKTESLHIYKHIAVVSSPSLDSDNSPALFYTVSLTHYNASTDELYGQESKNFAIAHYFHDQQQANKFAFTLSVQLGIDYHGKVEI